MSSGWVCDMNTGLVFTNLYPGDYGRSDGECQMCNRSDFDCRWVQVIDPAPVATSGSGGILIGDSNSVIRDNWIVSEEMTLEDALKLRDEAELAELIDPPNRISEEDE